MMEEVLLSATESICPECLTAVPARRVARGASVFLEKMCPHHGSFAAVIWRGPPAFSSWVRPKIPSHPGVPSTPVEQGCPLDCGLCAEHRQHTCTALIEVTQRCNLHCAFCFADAGGNQAADPSLADLKERFDRLLAVAGPCNVQLSGGEPTLRDDLPEIVALGRSRGFSFMQINTNGLRLANDPAFVGALKDAGVASVFLQFDGIEDGVYRKLRGRELLREKRLAIEHCAARGIGVVLVPTLVPGVNTGQIGPIIEFALQGLPTVRGVHFQPISYFGRYPHPPKDEDRITLPEIIREIQIQTNGRIRSEHFKPPGCENALCSFHGNFVLLPNAQLRPWTQRQSTDCGCKPLLAADGAAKARRFVAQFWSQPQPAPPRSVSAAAPTLGAWDEFLDRARTHSLSISAMAFQDAWNLDLDRLKDCCIHVVHADGRLIPFCAYNLTDSQGRSYYRNTPPGPLRCGKRVGRRAPVKITPLEGWIARRLGAGGAGLSRKQIESYQLGKLRETIGWAKARGPFYREHLAGFAEGDLTGLEDLARFPFTTAEDLRRQPLRFLCVSQGEVNRVVTLQTSGTTGDPKRVFFTVDDQERTIDFFHHGMSSLVGPGDRVLILLPGALPGSVGDLLMQGLERLGAVGVAHGPVREAAETLASMRKERINALVGIPTQVLGLARRSGGQAAPESVLLSTDHVPEAVSKELRRIWGCEVYTHYGMTEMGFGGGVECAARQGYHLREADLLVEIVDPETGRPVLEGDPGEVVFTTLTRRGMPLIRYRTGDLSRYLPDPCPCGTLLKTLARVKSRRRDLHPLAPGEPLSMADLDEAIFPIAGVLDFAASLTREQGGECLRIAVQATEPENQATLATLQEALNAVPVIKSALQQRRLAVRVSLLPAGQTVVRGSVKRAILDLRG